MLLPLPIIIKDLFREKTRMILTIVAIIWGTFAISMMLAIGEGLRTTFVKAVSGVGHNLLVVKGRHTTMSYQGLAENRPIKLEPIDLQAIATLDAIVAVSPLYAWSASLHYRDKVTAVPIQAVSNHYATIHNITVAPPGRFISPIDLEQKSDVMVLGNKTAQELFGTENPLYHSVMIDHRPFLVIGVMQPKQEIMGSRQPDASMNWIPATTYLQDAPLQPIDQIVVTYREGRPLAQLQAAITKVVAYHHHASPQDTHILHFIAYAERQARIDNFFTGLQIFLGAVGTLTLLVAGIGIANVMYASVKQATYEIGLRLAIGAKPLQILRTYLLEALLATLLGGVIGLMLAALAVWGIKQIPMHGKLFQIIGTPQPQLSLSVVIIVVLILGVVGVISGFFPAQQAAKIDPAEALSYE